MEHVPDREDQRAYQRKAVHKHRAEWRDLGFRPFSTTVHDDERELIMAELEVRRFIKLVELAENEATSVDMLHKIGMRNMIKLPKKADRDKLKSKIPNSVARKRIEDILERSVLYAKKFHGVDLKYDPDMPFDMRVRLEAKGTMYNNLSAAYFKLAKELLAYAGNATVFGVNVND